MGADPLRAEELQRRLPARRALARRIEVLAECTSTSDALRERLAQDGSVDGLLLAAEHQTGGRGRRERDWWSGPPAANLAVSLAIAPTRPPEALGLLAACALCAALAPWTAAPAAIKWPNDILIHGAKVAGLLAELPAAQPPLAILGLGVNVHAAPPAGRAAYAATCLDAHARRPIARTDLLAHWLLQLERRLAVFDRSGPEPLEAEFLRRLRAWAPLGVRAHPPGTPAGPLLQFSVSRGLTWGTPDAPATRPLGLIPALEPLPPPQ
ncbi:MAG: biotin--[acetyl-CoA-carboxylase] ligase [Planctomycetota bacterium]|nr:MAG: biotin--[acetyl-CoA-carboxylase] ligase [Planctomycetota bacterium]